MDFTYKSTNLSQKISENLQEQEDEMTALAEIIGDPQTFFPIDFANEGCQAGLVEEIHQKHFVNQYPQELKTFLEYEEVSRKHFFESLNTCYCSEDVSLMNIREPPKENFSRGGTLRVCPDLERSEYPKIEKHKGINIKCRFCSDLWIR